MPFHSRSRNRDRFGPDSVPVTDVFQSLDPSTLFGGSQDRRPDRKTFQLCKQAARALSFALGGDCRDDLLRTVVVDSVKPAPDASRLLLTVVPVVIAGADTQAILERLLQKKALLRAAVAQAINRKRAPELLFCVGWPGEVAP